MKIDTSNSQRFIAAYNSIDYALRTVYDIKRATGFSDAVRRAANNNAAIRKFEDDLIDYGRLRNSIVHNSGKTMAEPHLDVVERIEHIAKVLVTPPLAITTGRRSTTNVEAGVNVAAAITKHYETSYRNLPIIKNKAIVGVSNLTYIADMLAEIVHNKKSVDDYINKTTVEEFLRRKDGIEYYVIAKEDLTVSEALTLFSSNRRLACILFTPSGCNYEVPTGILTTADIIELNAILDIYDVKAD